MHAEAERSRHEQLPDEVAHALDRNEQRRGARREAWRQDKARERAFAEAYERMAPGSPGRNRLPSEAFRPRSTDWNFDPLSLALCAAPAVMTLAEVYLAEPPRLPRRDAVKILGSDISAGVRQRLSARPIWLRGAAVASAHRRRA